MCLIPPPTNNNLGEVLSTKKAHVTLSAMFLLGAGHIPDFHKKNKQNTPGVPHKPNCLYKQFRHSEAFII